MTKREAADAADGSAAPEGGAVVLVTGAAGQLGSAIAASVAARGARLVLADLSAAGLERLAMPPARCETVACDITRPGIAEGLVERALTRFRRLDAVVNNAGIEGSIGPLESVALDDLRRLFDINVFAVVAVMQAVLPHFKEVGAGRIVNIASGAGLAGTGLMAPYSASKHAVVGFTRSVAQEAAADGVVVNAVCPGVVESPMMARIEARLAELRGEPVSYRDAVPMKRYAEPKEVGDLVAWLALDAPAYVNGAALVIDGALRA